MPGLQTVSTHQRQTQGDASGELGLAGDADSVASAVTCRYSSANQTHAETAIGWFRLLVEPGVIFDDQGEVTIDVVRAYVNAPGPPVFVMCRA